MANSTADGSVVIDVDMNVSQAEKRLGKLRGDIKKTEKEIADATAARDEVQARKDDFAKKLELEQAKLKELTDQMTELKTSLKDPSLSKGVKQELRMEQPVLQQQISEQRAAVNAVESEWNKVNKDVDRYSQKIESATQKLDEQNTEADLLTQQIDEAVKKENGFAKASAAAEKSMGRMGRRITELVNSAFIFNVISAGLRSIQQLTMKYIKTNNEARAEIAQLKGALLTLAQPLIEVIIPAFTLFVNILTKIITAVAQFVSLLFGKTLKQSKDGAKALHKEANAIGAVGEAADEAAGSLAGFDEINQINTESAKNAGGVGGAGNEILPDFGDFDPGKYKDIIDELMVYLSGALLVIGAILLFSGANIPLGLGLMVIGAAVLAQEIKENWGAIDGKVRDAVNRMLIILGGALLVIGAILCFSGANIPLGIGLMILGAAMLATAAALNWSSLGEEVQSALSSLLQIIGAMIAVIGVILAVTGRLALGIGLIIAGIALFAVGEAAGEDGDFLENLRSKLSDALGIIGGFLAVVGLLLIVTRHFLTGLALLIAGIAVFEYSEVRDDNGMTMQEKIKTVLEKTLEAVSPIVAIVGLFLLVTGHFLTGLSLLIAGIAIFEYSKVKDDGGMSVQEKITTTLKNTLKIATGFLLVLGLILLLIPKMWPTAIALIAAGVIGLVTAKALDDEAMQKKLKEMWEKIKSWWKRDVEKFLTVEYWKNLGKNIIDGFLGGLKKAWETVSSWAREVVDWFTGLFGGAKSSVNGLKSGNSSRALNVGRMAAQSLPSIPPVSIPALAKGAVIPPNREFMAVLGDQRRGYNVEAPADLIRQMVIEGIQAAGASGGSGQPIQVNVMLDKRVLARAMVNEVNDMTRQAGKPVLLI